MPHLDAIEEWRPVLGFAGFYEVSSHGRVRSLDRAVVGVNGVVQNRRSKILRPGLTRGGYAMVVLHRGRVRKAIGVHVLVAEAFHGPRPEGMAVCHANDIKLDNRPENLRFDTWSENQLDRVRNGIHPNSNQTHCKHGHEFTVENTYRYGRARACRTCCRIRARERRAAQKVA